LIELFRNPNYDFIGKRKWAYIVSIAITLIGLISLAARGGLRYDIDFTGGTLIQVRFERPPTVAQIRTSLGTIQLGESIIQQFGDAQEFIIRLPLVAAGSEEIARRVQGALGANDSLGKFEIRRVEFVGPQVGRELQLQALYLVLAGLIWIAIYLAFRFDLRGGVAAVVAVLMLVARPLTVFACALPDRRARWTLQEMLFMCWTRETGVIPAALAGLLLGMNAPEAQLIASVTFVAILMTILIQAPTTRWLGGRLGLLEGGAKR